MNKTSMNLSSSGSKQPWIPPKERIWVFAAAALAVLAVGDGLANMLHVPDFHTRGFKDSFKNYGSWARIALFFVLANYVLTVLLRKRLADRPALLKKLAVSLLRIAKKWHTPVAVLAIAVILLHVVGAFLYGIQLDFHNISGLLALAALLPVPVAGLFRYKRMDRKWHLRSGLAFAFLFLIHAFL